MATAKKKTTRKKTTAKKSTAKKKTTAKKTTKKKAAKGRVVAAGAVSRKKGYMYFVDGSGNVRETKMNTSGGKKGRKICKK